MYRFKIEDITHLYLRLDVYASPFKTYIMQPPVEREPDSITLHMDKPDTTEKILHFDVVRSHPPAYWLEDMRAKSRQLVFEKNALFAAVTISEVEDSRFVTIHPNGELRIYTIGITVDGLGDIPWNYIPHGIKLKLTEG